MKTFTRTVWTLSIISLFTDMASEMLYPVMPLYLNSIGFSMVLIGLLEGLAEATAGLSKGYFGRLSDVSGRRVPFVQLGYALSALSKPLMVVFAYPLWVFAVRTLDRAGKGVRTGARDALLAAEATTGTKGKVFGLHRSMDTIGAVIGPAAALGYLWLYPGGYKMLFFIAFLPGLLAIAASFFLREKGEAQGVQLKKRGSFFAFLRYWKTSPVAYRQLVAGLLAFTLINSSDVFLLLKAKQAGLTDLEVIGVYIFYNLVYAASAFPMGILGDKIGLKKVFLLGLAVFSTVYIGMSVSSNVYVIGGLFFGYGLYAAATEGISKAWISNISDKKDAATAIGTYAGLQSLCALLASTLAGAIWYGFGPGATFLVAGVGALGVLGYLAQWAQPPASG